MDENKINSEDRENLENLSQENGFQREEKGNSDSSKDKKSKMKGSEKKLISEIQELEQKNEELKDKYLRIVAEYDNYRRRTIKEKTEIGDSVKASVMLNFLPVVDDMDRAVHFLDDKAKESSMTNFVEGIKLIDHKLHEFLRSGGVKEIEALGKEFDTDLHEAVTKIPIDDEDMKGKVIDVIQKGYTLNDKVIRFSKVVVGE
jgi:molecular chaperone GrpE